MGQFMDGILIGHSKTTEDLFIFVPGRNMLCYRERRGRETEAKPHFCHHQLLFYCLTPYTGKNCCTLCLKLKIWAIQLQCQWAQKFRLWSTSDSMF